MAVNAGLVQGNKPCAVAYLKPSESLGSRCTTVFGRVRCHGCGKGVPLEVLFLSGVGFAVKEKACTCGAKVSVANWEGQERDSRIVVVEPLIGPPGGMAPGLDIHAVRTEELPSRKTVPGDEAILHFDGHKGFTWDLDFSPGGILLASAADDHTVRLWDVAGGTLRRCIDTGQEEVETLAFSVDEKQQYGVTEKGRVVVGDVAGGGFCEVVPSPGPCVGGSPTLSGDVTVAAIPLGNKIALVSLQKGRVFRELTCADSEREYYRLALSPDGQYLFSTERRKYYYDKTPTYGRLWDTTSGAEVWQSTDCSENLALFAPAGRAWLSLDKGYKLTLREVPAGVVLTSFASPGSVSGRGVGFSPDARILVVGQEAHELKETGGRWRKYESTVYLIDAAKGNILRQFRGLGSDGPATFSPDGGLVAAGGGGSESCTIRLWAVPAGLGQPVPRIAEQAAPATNAGPQPKKWWRFWK